jgi:hypothetical protein
MCVHALRDQAGVVESINPLSIVVRNDRSVPVSIPNRMLVELMICNESKVKVRRPPFPLPHILQFLSHYLHSAIHLVVKMDMHGVALCVCVCV